MVMVYSTFQRSQHKKYFYTNMKIYNIQVTSIVCVYSYMPSCRYNDDDDNNYVQKQDERETSGHDKVDMYICIYNSVTCEVSR